jgi:xylose isomerase
VLDWAQALAARLQRESRVRPRWGTAQLFKHPRYMHGAATSENGGGRVAAGSQLQQGGGGNSTGAED